MGISTERFNLWSFSPYYCLLWIRLDLLTDNEVQNVRWDKPDRFLYGSLDMHNRAPWFSGPLGAPAASQKSAHTCRSLLLKPAGCEIVLLEIGIPWSSLCWNLFLFLPVWAFQLCVEKSIAKVESNVFSNWRLLWDLRQAEHHPGMDLSKTKLASQAQSIHRPATDRKPYYLCYRYK